MNFFAAVRDILKLYFAPGSLFARLPQQHRSAWPLVLLILLYELIALGMLSTGVVEHETVLRTRENMKKIQTTNERDDPLEAERKMAEKLEQQEKFNVQMARLGLFVLPVISLFVVLGTLTAILFTLSALHGTKPDLGLLAEVAVFAHFVEVPRRLFVLWLTAHLQVVRIETSLAAFVAPEPTGLPAYLCLRRFDPFVLWFWLILFLGVWKTKQMRAWLGIITVVVLACAASFCHCMADSAELIEWIGEWKTQAVLWLDR